MKKIVACIEFCKLLETLKDTSRPASELAKSISSLTILVYDSSFEMRDYHKQEFARIDDDSLILFSGDFRYYKKLFNPYEDSAFVESDLVDDLLDIYNGCKAYLESSSADAETIFKQEITTHLIYHLLGAASALYFVSFERGEE